VEASTILNARYLIVFRAVAKAGSVSAAARMLNVSQPAVTKTIRLLEGRLGLALFLRVNGRLVITPEAELLMPEIERLFGTLNVIKSLADEVREGVSGSISIASVTTLSVSLVAKAVEDFHRTHPGVRFDILSLPTRLAVQHVATNYVDLGVLDAPTGALDMETVELCRSRVACVCRRDHPLARRRYIEPRHLAGETVISFSEDTTSGMLLREAFHSASLDLTVHFTVNHTMTAYTLVRRGVGVALVDSFPTFSGDYADLVVRPFHPAIETRSCVVFSSTRAVPIVARYFVESLKQAAAEMINDSRDMLSPP
jgi:DNA-binding transcriptional LysR family regulator